MARNGKSSMSPVSNLNFHVLFCGALDSPEDAVHIFYPENYKSSFKEIKEDPFKWGEVLCCWVRILNIIKMTILPRVI